MHLNDIFWYVNIKILMKEIFSMQKNWLKEENRPHILVILAMLNRFDP